MTVEGMMNKEWLDELAAASDDELIEKLRYFSCDPYFYDLFDPLVEEIQKRLNKAEPARRGRWIKNLFEREWDICSCCKTGTKRREFGVTDDGREWVTEESYTYCPWCGARMEGQE